MKRLRLLYEYLRLLRSGGYVLHKTSEGLVMELSSNGRTYTFKRKAVVIGSYLGSIQFAEAQAQQLAFENIKTQCPECGLEPFHVVFQDGHLRSIRCTCHRQEKSPA